MKLTHIRLLVVDYQACFRFYRDVMGFEVTYGDENGPYADFDTGETNLALFDRRLMAAVVGNEDLATTAVAQDQLALIFGVPDVDQTFAGLKQAGVAVVNEPHDQSTWGIRAAHFRDPEGNLLEINQPL